MKESVWQEIKKIITAVIHCRSEKISIKGEDEQEKLSEGKEKDAFVCVQTRTHKHTILGLLVFSRNILEDSPTSS